MGNAGGNEWRVTMVVNRSRESEVDRRVRRDKVVIGWVKCEGSYISKRFETIRNDTKRSETVVPLKEGSRPIGEPQPLDPFHGSNRLAKKRNGERGRFDPSLYRSHLISISLALSSLMPCPLTFFVFQRAHTRIRCARHCLWIFGRFDWGLKVCL